MYPPGMLTITKESVHPPGMLTTYPACPQSQKRACTHPACSLPTRHVRNHKSERAPTRHAHYLPDMLTITKERVPTRHAHYLPGMLELKASTRNSDALRLLEAFVAGELRRFEVHIACTHESQFKTYILFS